MEKADTQTAQQLKNFIEKIERLEDEKSELLETIREAFSEAKGFGFDPKIMKKVLKLRKMKREEYLEQEHLLETYLSALGMS
ncbi:MAG: DUF2312 domain-containing protein [Holosporales bacterium]|nr:DUF2312 domain-containing protein [Holosporales bacterium]